MSLGQNIKRKRQELKLSQEYIAEQLGVSRQAVSKWETGQSEPTSRNLVDLATLFEISLSELVDPNRYDVEKKKSNSILRTNLSLLAIAFHTGFLYSCTHISYKIVDGNKTPDFLLIIIKIIFLLLCSFWMVRNLMCENNLEHRKKNIKIELVYCVIQLAIAICIFKFKLGLIGLLIMLFTMLLYILYINPKYMNRPFGKKRYY